MADAPRRVRRSRAKGARLPENTICVDRSTRWGNPFVVGKHGTRAECVKMFSVLMQGFICVSDGPEPNLQMAYRDMVVARRGELRGKNLACWCGPGPCHADVLLEIAKMAPDAPVGPMRPVTDSSVTQSGSASHEANEVTHGAA